MKYLVNRETKEHKVATPLAESIIKGYPDFKDDWQLVEADSEGWIPWSGGDCPLPDDHKYDVKSARYRRPLLGFDEPQTNYWRQDGDIAAYRPVLAETAENQSNNGTFAASQSAPCGIAISSLSVFDRLKSAVAASESIPNLLAEINALLPDGYCVTRCVEQPAEDMTDWTNWRDGDLIECVNDEGWETFHVGGIYKFTTSDEWRGFFADGLVVGPSYTQDFRFHSRPAKESV